MLTNNFKLFFEEKEMEDVNKLLNKLPTSHKKLIHGFKFKYTGNNTLNGDKKHVGVIYGKKIEVAAPWNYGREFTTLHEIAHLVWSHKLTPKLKKEWAKLLKSTKKEMNKKEISKSSLNQGAEEIFAMSYANYYSKHKILTYNHPKWMDFIKEKVPD